MKRSSLFLTMLLSVAGLSMAGCGGPAEYAMVGTARAAGADGTVTVEQIEGGNSLVTVQMQHLPPPERLGEGLKTYVVWFDAGSQSSVKAGGLGYDEDSREGNMMATTPLKKFTVKITAEQSIGVSTPSDVVVAKRQVSQ